MALKQLPARREVFDDRAQNAEARTRAELTDRLQRCPFIIGRIVSVKVTSGTTKTVRHGLGVPAAFIVVRQNYDGTGTQVNVTEAASASQAKLDLSNQLAITPSATGKVDLWFYPRASRAIDATTGQST